MTQMPPSSGTEGKFCSQKMVPWSNKWDVKIAVENNLEAKCKQEMENK